MNEFTNRHHVLQISECGQIWYPADAGMYREAFMMAHHGELTKAIETAEKTRIREYGDMHEIYFRVVSVIRTVTCKGAMTEERIA